MACGANSVDRKVSKNLSPSQRDYHKLFPVEIVVYFQMHCWII